jgi:hypothetical protein
MTVSLVGVESVGVMGSRPRSPKARAKKIYRQQKNIYFIECEKF